MPDKENLFKCTIISNNFFEKRHSSGKRDVISVRISEDYNNIKTLNYESLILVLKRLLSVAIGEVYINFVSARSCGSGRS